MEGAATAATHHRHASLILVGLLMFGIGYAVLFRVIATAWPPSVHQRALRLALIVWLATAFSEFMGPFNVLHEPAALATLAGMALCLVYRLGLNGLGFWAVSALAQAYTLVLVADRR